MGHDAYAHASDSDGTPAGTAKAGPGAVRASPAAHGLTAPPPLTPHPGPPTARGPHRTAPRPILAPPGPPGDTSGEAARAHRFTRTDRIKPIAAPSRTAAEHAAVTTPWSSPPSGGPSRRNDHVPSHEESASAQKDEKEDEKEDE
ncbi:hypothetical protein AB0E83_12395 [Streptomyces sp. NPDC035033]|uniref:hypothetical protein n=1 Tax=Streptomyces sp. NPDC035033 TaxID=3155368 RepID=UPI0034031C0B